MADGSEIKPADVRAWRSRWAADRLDAVNRHLTRFWNRAGSTPRQPLNLTPLGLDRHETRADLRGITLSRPLACFEVVDADFSGMRFAQAGQLGPYSRFVGCRFDRAEKPGNLREEFERCSFDRANLHRAVLGRTFVGCTFRSANLQTSLANEAVFRDCEFGGADLRHVQWYTLRFERCRFVGCKFGKGSLAGSSFTDCEVNAAALEQADVLLEGVRFGEPA
jgi:uncharacterized protein YjbI with pentapeptide repeats